MLSKRNLFLPGVPRGRPHHVVAAHLLSSADAVVQDNVVAGLLDLFEIWNALSFSYSNIWVLQSSSSNFLLLGLFFAP